MHKGKIFVIGLNKTGTTSLHKALEMLGYRSIHFTDDRGRNIKGVIRDNVAVGRDILDSLEQYDAISDWHPGHEWQLFTELDKQHPGAKFILLWRDLDTWLSSREKHIKRGIERKNNSAWKVDREKWTKDWYEHLDFTRDYFKDRPNDLLEMNLIAGDGWGKLAPFLGHEVPGVEFPKANKAPRNSKQRGFTRRLMQLFRIK